MTAAITSGAARPPNVRTVAAASALNACWRTIETGIVLLLDRGCDPQRTGDSTTAGFPDEPVSTLRSLRTYECPLATGSVACSTNRAGSAHLPSRVVLAIHASHQQPRARRPSAVTTGRALVRR